MTQKKMNEGIVLLNFLKSGFSTRKIDAILGFSKTRGWKSWEIIKRYELKDWDKGKLFLYSRKQAREIINKLVSGRKLDEIIQKHPSKILEKYKETFVLAKSEKSFYDIFSGEAANIVQRFFNPEKKLIGVCQFRNCKNRDLHTAHFSEDRPRMFMRCALKFKERYGKEYKFDVHHTMDCFLRSHSKKKSVCFLCKKHHDEFHRLENISKNELNKFKGEVVFRREND